MSFTLRIEFTGLCMFVPEEAGPTSPARMHVLLPKRPHEHGEDRHVAVLAYNTANIQPGAPADPDSRVLRTFSAPSLTIPGAGVEQLSICPEIVNLRPVAGRDAAPHNTGKLVARVTMEAGKMTRVQKGACWEFPAGNFRNLAHRAEWTISNLAGPGLELQFKEFDDPDPVRTLTLYPTDSGGSSLLDLAVMYVPAGDLPPKPEEHHEPEFGAEPMHFLSYYSLFGQPVPVVLPKFYSKDDDCGASSCPSFPERGGSPFNCMLASSYGPG